MDSLFIIDGMTCWMYTNEWNCWDDSLTIHFLRFYSNQHTWLINMFRQEPTFTVGIQRNSKRDDLHGLRQNMRCEKLKQAKLTGGLVHKLLLVLRACCLHITDGSNWVKRQNNGVTKSDQCGECSNRPVYIRVGQKWFNTIKVLISSQKNRCAKHTRHSVNALDYKCSNDVWFRNYVISYLYIAYSVYFSQNVGYWQDAII